MNRISEREKILLAALLHDIGKFWQRADSGNSYKSSAALSQETKDLARVICPRDPREKKYEKFRCQHALWTYQFFQDYFRRPESGLAECSAKHHLPDTFEQQLVQLADWWSAGMERSGGGKPAPGDSSSADWGKYAFKNKPLHSLFADVSLHGKGGPVGVYPITPLSLATPEIVTPISVENAGKDDRQANYAASWQGFCREFEQLPHGNFNVFLESLLPLLKKYTWCIPSDTNNMANVSLYEHLKTTAGIASALFDFWAEEQLPRHSGPGEVLANRPELMPLLLCCLDISGIQKFIYDVASSKAYRSLKGRSFYLSLLLDALLKKLLAEANLSPANVIYASGGMAFLLAPNIACVRDAMTTAVDQLNKELWEEHFGNLFVALGWTPFRYNFEKADHFGQLRSSEVLDDGQPIHNLGDLWRAATERTARQKQRKFVTLLQEELFEPKDAGDVDKFCAVTGEGIPKNTAKNIGRNEDIPVLPSVYEQVELGNRLRRARLLAAASFADGRASDASFSALGQAYHLLRELPAPADPNPYTLYSINETDFLPAAGAPANRAYGFLFYGGSTQPMIQEKGIDRSKTLEELCEIKPGVTAKMGLLRMDVDNLGKVFIRGLPVQQRSFAALATLSFHLDYFFSGWLNRLREKLGDDQEHLVILYSGGDDVFALGRWDVVLRFAGCVRKGFRQLVNDHPDLTLSAGIAVVSPKFPIYKAAELAGDAEKKAKQFRNGEKNAVCLFGEALSWKEEWELVKKLQEKLFNLVENHRMNRALLHQLQRYRAVVQQNDQRRREGHAPDFSYKWHQAYYLKRFEERHQSKKEVVEFVRELLANLTHYPKLEGPDRYLQLAAVAARWAEYRLKMSTK